MLPVVNVIVVFTQRSLCAAVSYFALFVEYHCCMGGHSLTTHMHTHTQGRLGGSYNFNDRDLMWVANKQTG